MTKSGYINRVSIKHKIIAIILSITFLCISVGVAFFAFWDINRIKSDIQSNLQLHTKLIADYCIVPLTFGDNVQATEALSRLQYIDFVETGCLYDKDGNIFATYPDTLSQNDLVLIPSQDGCVYRDNYFYSQQSALFKGEIYGTLLIKANSKRLVELKSKLAIFLPLGALVIVFLSYLLAGMMQRIISKPILKLKDHIESVANNQDFTHVIVSVRNDEIGSLYDGFNNLLKQINRRQQERDRAVEKRRLSEEKYKLLVDSAPMPICFVDNSGAVTFMNASFKEVLGYSVLDIPTLDSWWQIAFPESEYQKWVINNWYSGFNKTVDGDSGVSSDEYKVVCKGGDIRYFIVSSIKLNDGILTTFIDITDRNQAREDILKLNEDLELRVKQRTIQLEAANKELEAFAYSVSHDLRAPLRAIDGFTQILTEEYISKLDDEGKRLGDIIQSNTKKMGKLIDDLLAFSRIGRASINMTLIDMSCMVNAIYHEITTENQRLNHQFSIAELPNLVADTNMMRQVWINLISNAVKYSGNRDPAIIEVSGYQENNNLVYCIKDNGVGFNMKYENKLFGVFQRLHSDAEFEGTGVGLALVQRIVHRHDGNVWAKSIVDKGAEFYFSIPQKKQG